MECNRNFNYKEAHDASASIFLGKVIEVKPVLIDTSHHGEKKYWDAKFKVLKSWKQIDKEFVWIELANKKTLCNEIKEGEVYLVFANNHENSHLFIESNTRLLHINNELTEKNLTKLGNNTIKLEKGNFTPNENTFFDLSIALSISLCTFLFIFLLIKKI